jgi:hypothetical protein
MLLEFLHEEEILFAPLVCASVIEDKPKLELDSICLDVAEQIP